MTLPRWRANLAGRCVFFLEAVAQYDNPDDTISALGSMLEQLSAVGRRAWRLAHKKEFDVGYDAARSQPVWQFALRAETLLRLSKLGATLGVTFYCHPTGQSNRPAKPAPPQKSRK
jgi:hypothetical protein